MSSDQLFKDFTSKISSLKDNTLIEDEFYKVLTKSLRQEQFDSFRHLIENSIKFNIFIDIKKIPNRFEIISTLLLNCVERVSVGYQTSALGDIIDILRFCQEFNLFEKEINGSERKYLEIIKRDKVFLLNLEDLFGKVSNSFIIYVYKVLPRNLYEYFINNPLTYFPNQDGLMNYIKNVFFNQYSIYGLNVRYLSPVERFINIFNKNVKLSESKDKSDIINFQEENLIEFDIIYSYKVLYYDSDEELEHHEVKRHLVSPENILRNLNKILNKNNYNFYNLSMVLKGGLGPQGLGFTYSTPKGEIIEICSDQKETEAIIIKFKQFLKEQFLIKLGTELEKLKINLDLKIKIINFLSEILNQNVLINYSKKNSIVEKIVNYLSSINEIQNLSIIEFQNLTKKISKAVSLILRNVKLKDQFITRMELVANGKIHAEDIAKLTSLRGKSHYDILRERFFFQYIVDWFYEIYQREKTIK